METIEVANGKFNLPKEFVITKTKRRLTIKSAWRSEVQRLGKDNWQVSIQQWFRNKETGDKPYIPEGFIDIDGIRFKVVKI